MVVCTLVVSLLTYVSVKALSCVTILYGRRRFILMVLAGFAWQSLFRLAVQQHFIAAEMDTVGFIIPGLIANEMERQRILPTLMAMVVVSILVRLALIAFGLLS
jgi:poly-gamma-glutamate biosynthesis protein PgsC/CapC